MMTNAQEEQSGKDQIIDFSMWRGGEAGGSPTDNSKVRENMKDMKAKIKRGKEKVRKHFVEVFLWEIFEMNEEGNEEQESFVDNEVYESKQEVEEVESESTTEMEVDEGIVENEEIVESEQEPPKEDQESSTEEGTQENIEDQENVEDQESSTDSPTTNQVVTERDEESKLVDSKGFVELLNIIDFAVF